MIHFDRTHGALKLFEYISSNCLTTPCPCRAKNLAGEFVSCRISCMDDALAVYGHNRWNGILLCAALLDDRNTVFHHCNRRIGRAEVNASVDFSVDIHI